MRDPCGRSRPKNIFRAAGAFVSLLPLIFPPVLGGQEIPRAKHHYQAGLTLEAERKYGEATGEFKRAIELNPEFTDAYYHLGLTCFKENKPTEAIRYLMRLNQLEPANLNAAIAAGQIYSRLGYFNEAVTLYLRVLQKRGELPDVAGEKEGAQNGFEPYAKGTPNAAEASYYLGVLEIDAAQYRSAITQLKKAISLNPELGIPFCYLGEVYVRLGELSQAEEALRRCLSRDPNCRPALQVMQGIKAEHR